MNRTEERLIAFEIVFSFPFYSETEPEELMKRYSECADDIVLTDYIVSTVKGIADNLEQIDQKIRSSIKTRTFDRLDKICLAAMRLAVYEMLYNNDVPIPVAINEAIEITKKYDESLAGYVHANLGIISGSENE